MTRMIGINMVDRDRIDHALTAIYGIGKARSGVILDIVKIDRSRQVKDLTDVELKTIQDEIEKKIRVEGDLKEEINNNIKRLSEIGSYRGIRHMKGLPVHGQRTKSNARTKRGKRKTIGALKKEDMMKMDQNKK